MKRRERFVPLTDDSVEETDGWPLHVCNWCIDKREVPAVIILEHESAVHRFFGVCGNHAELMNRKLEEWTEY